MTNMFALERYKTPIAGPALAYLNKNWTTTSHLLSNGYIVGAVRSTDRYGDSKGVSGWDDIDDYREPFENGCTSWMIKEIADGPASQYSNIFHGLITRRGIEALYKSHSITFSEGIDIWETRERAREAWAIEHPHEFLVVKYPNDAVGDQEHQQPDRWARRA